MSQLNGPFHGDIKSAPGPHENGCDYLEHTEVPDLKKHSDTSVLTPTFYADTEALKWSKDALDSPMGTAIVKNVK